jgi:hypothetical protein
MFRELPMAQDSPPLGKVTVSEGRGNTVTFTVPSAYFVGSREQEALTFRITVWFTPVKFWGAVQVGFCKLGLEKEPDPMEEEKTDQE